MWVKLEQGDTDGTIITHGSSGKKKQVDARKCLSNRQHGWASNITVKREQHIRDDQNYVQSVCIFKVHCQSNPAHRKTSGYTMFFVSDPQVPSSFSTRIFKHFLAVTRDTATYSCP